MSAERSLARRYFEDLFNAGDYALADVILAPDITFGGPLHPVGIQGLDAFKDFIQAWYRGFPDRRFELLEEWVEPDRIATVFRVTGTHLGEFMAQPGTGNVVDMTAMNHFRITGGRIRAVRAFFDPAQMLRPLGLAPY